MKKTKTQLLRSFIALMLCLTMLIGATFAWFTDNVTSSGNIIKSGTLDLEMYWTDDLGSGVWHDVEDEDYNTVFNYDNWEPGYTDVKYIKLVNKGDLALNYKLALTPQNGIGKLAEVINVYFAEGGVELDTREDLKQLNALGLLSNVVDGRVTANGTLLPASQESPLHASDEVVLTLAMSMITSAGNDYQDETSGEFTITALATQASYESDSFGTDYDSDAQYDALIIADKASASVTPVNGKVPTGGVTLSGETISAYVPEGVALDEGTSQLTLSITPLENTASGITVVNNEILIPVDVHIDGVAENNTVPIIVDLGAVLPKYLNMGNYHLFHVEENGVAAMNLVNSKEELNAHNQFTYNSDTGEVSVAMTSFSEVALVADEENAWQGTYDFEFDGEGTQEKPYIISKADELAGFGAIVGGMKEQERNSYTGKHFKLIADINLGCGEGASNNGTVKTFYPIGYYNNTNVYERDSAIVPEGGVISNVCSFEGIFDGNGHTISNFYQNTWEMFGDYNDGYSGTPNYYKDAMGLFGYVNGGTITNLTVDHFSSDGEFTPTGVIAAYAVDSTFENIAITNCNPRVYNTGNGGIVGVGGNSDDANDKKLNFANITIDNTNKISALWGSWDVACGGVMGMFRGWSKVHFENCHVAAQIDVYNDVCGNYQYYWYRYSGMMIGSLRGRNTTDANGYTVPDMKDITANASTVHFGTWNDYYYCELVANSLASYTHDHQFSRLEQITTLDEIKEGGNWTKNGNFLLIDGETKTCYHIMKDKDGNLYEHKHDVKDATNEEINETVDGKIVLKEDKQIVYLPFNQLFQGDGWGVKHIPIYNGENYAFAGITILDREVADSVQKFETKFTGNFLYRVGNGNAVTVGSLFEAKEGVDINSSGVYVTVTKVDENTNVSGTYKANSSDWTNGTIQFTGTGVVKVTIQDYVYCEPTVLYLEVVDAMNATSVTSATKNNVVLLQDCGFSSVEVSNGYTLYGNGFTMACGSDSVASDMGYAFVTLNNGTLDNVQIVCPNYDYAALYKTNLTSSDNRSETDASGKTRYYNAKSGVMASGNSQILNSRISGGRASLNVSGGNIVVDNSRIELGAVASVLVGTANSLTLRDTTLVQKPTESTYDKNKTLMGFSVLYLCDSEGNATPTTLEGSFVQQAWIDEGDAKYVPSAGKDIVTTVLKETDYLHDIDGDGTNESLNLGFAYMPEDPTKTVDEPANITDNRIDKTTIPYAFKAVKVSITTVYVYSYKNTNGTVDSFKKENEYTPNKYSDIITVTYSDTTEGLTTGKSYGIDGWVYELNVDLDKVPGYALDFSKLSMSVNGVSVTEFKVNGSAKPISLVVVVAGGTNYTLTATIDGKEYTATYKVTGTETSKESPSLVVSNYEEGLCVASSYGGTWHGAAPALEGVQIKYWSVAEQQYKTINLSDYTPTTKGKLNGTNTTWTYSPDNGDFTLTLTGGQVHSSNNVYAMPVVCDGKLYFVAASSNGLVNSGNGARTIPVSYSFRDNNNGDELKFSHTWSVAENKDTQYKYSDFCNGTLTQLENCVTPDTLITLADGSQVRVDSLTGTEQLLVWNMETGSLDSAPIMFVDNEAEAEVEVIKLFFSDGTEVKVISEHGFWDYDLNKYVYLDRNAAEYIGHTFAKQNGDKLDKVALVDVVLENQVTTAWSPVTAGHLCYFVNGMLSMPGGVGGLFNIFDVDAETMTYDYEAMARDIETYGLFTYEELSQYADLSKEMFDAAGGQFLKVSIGKGNMTMDELVAMINRYGKFFE